MTIGSGVMLPNAVGENAPGRRTTLVFIEVLARAGSLSVAYAAYWAALAARPRSRIVLRQRALELAACDPSR